MFVFFLGLQTLYIKAGKEEYFLSNKNNTASGIVKHKSRSVLIDLFIYFFLAKGEPLIDAIRETFFIFIFSGE